MIGVVQKIFVCKIRTEGIEVKELKLTLNDTDRVYYVYVGYSKIVYKRAHFVYVLRRMFNPILAY